MEVKLLNPNKIKSSNKDNNENKRNPKIKEILNKPFCRIELGLAFFEAQYFLKKYV